MDIKEIKDTYVNHIKEFMCEVGSLDSMVTVFAEHIDKQEDDIPAIIHIPVPPKFLESEKAKDEFVDTVIPEIFSEIKKKFIPEGVAWASEAWMRMTENSEDLEDWKSLPIKKEILIISIETKDSKEGYIFEIKRNGKQINSEGDLVDKIELEENMTFDKNSIVDGRFTKLFDKL